MKTLISLAFATVFLINNPVLAADDAFDLITVEEAADEGFENNYDRVRAAKQSKRPRLPNIEETKYNGGKTNLENEDLTDQLLKKKYGDKAPTGAEKVVLQEPVK